MQKESDLKRWFKEKWIDISRKDKSGKHPECGRDDSTEGGYPKCRPSKKISKETPTLSRSLSKRDKNKAVNIKRKKENSSPDKYENGGARKPKYTKLSEENKSLISERLEKLASELSKIGGNEYRRTMNLKDSIDKKNKIIKFHKDLFFYLEDNDVKINIDSPKGSKKGFGSSDKRKIPFDYGEIVGIINPSDDMGWDIIFPPSQRPDGGKLIPIGIVIVNPDEKAWRKNSKTKPPIGNDKIIVSNNGNISKEDQKIISDFFEQLWQFKKIKWLI